MSSLLFVLCTLHILTNLVQYVSCVDSGGIVEACSENELAFGCKEDNSIIAVKEAWLHDAYYRIPKHKCKIPEYYLQFKKGSVLQHINKKCAMNKGCRFNVWEDVPGAKEDEERWLGSVIRVNYECVKNEAISRTCGETIEIQEGWIQSIGYPKYYLGPGACTFTLIMDPGQKVNLNIFDLSLREIVRPTETDCTDYISVTEGTKELFATCGDPNRPIKVTSEDHILNVTLHSSEEVYPKRGFVANFRAVGCPTPEIPEDGYLSHRNATYAEFWCCVRHVFPDSMARVRTLTCKSQLYWDKDVPNCIDLDDLLQSGNITEDEYWRYNGSTSASKFMLKEEVIYDIILPGVIMTVLIFGNVGVLLLIVLCRRRIKADSENLEELDSIKDNAEPTDICDPSPCEV